MTDVSCWMILENAVIYLFSTVFPLLTEHKTHFSIQFSEVIINEVIFFLLCKAAVTEERC